MEKFYSLLPTSMGGSVTYTYLRGLRVYLGNSRHTTVPCDRTINMKKITVTISAGHFYILLSIQANSKIMKVKEEIQRTTQIAINKQFLIFGGKVLEDQKRISHYCIHDFSLIEMSQVLRGGGKTVKPPTNIIKSTQYTLKRFFTTN